MFNFIILTWIFLSISPFLRSFDAIMKILPFLLVMDFGKSYNRKIWNGPRIVLSSIQSNIWCITNICFLFYPSVIKRLSDNLYRYNWIGSPVDYKFISGNKIFEFGSEPFYIFLIQILNWFHTFHFILDWFRLWSNGPYKQQKSIGLMDIRRIFRCAPKLYDAL